MRPRKRGVATYLQTFVLIAIALGGSLVAYREVSAYADAAAGPEISVSGVTLRQEAGVALERLTVADSGTSVLPSFDLINPGLPSDVFYCYTVASASGTLILETCPSMVANPTSITIPVNLTSGSTVVAVVILEGGGVFIPGGTYPVVVTSPGAGTSSQQVVATQG